MYNLSKTGVLLINQGTPDSPAVADVRKYLREFLMDARVLDIPFLNRWMLVNLIIAPTRAPKSAKVYQELWTPQGSPLKVYGYEVAQQLQHALGNNYFVRLGMRYQNPAVPDALHEFRMQGISRIVVIPLYPQYASATTGSASQQVTEVINKWQVVPELHTVQNFLSHPKFVEAFAENGRRQMAQENYDHYVFTYHGLPERQLHKKDYVSNCHAANCTHAYNALNQHCYRAQCYETSRLIAEKLGIAPADYTVAFQSRLGNAPWIKPYTEDVVKQLTKRGVKKVLAFAPSFIADCLETTVEVGREYRELFEENGGETWHLVESLNKSSLWIECLQDIVMAATGKATSETETPNYLSLTA
ncbi:ferrochelatase [Pontibacter korlensis]|uniref:ferrochelatase n=1 Tax=Pontibacter korlensis TaxID=400092 RepID=UPI00061AD8B0|nr:ferrochelatase [Pontibacter korlensis]